MLNNVIMKLDIKNLMICAAASAWILSSCSGEKGEDGPSHNPDSYETINITPDKTTVLRNPLCGWVLYAGLGNDLSDFWKRYDSMESSVGPVNVSEYASTLLIRTSWGQLNPEEGVYVW